MADEVVELTISKASIELISEFRARMAPIAFLGRMLQFFKIEALRVAGRATRFATTGELGIRRRDGTLARSITGVPVVREGAPGMRIGIFRGPALAYAGVQEHGTRGKNPASPYDTIRPKKGNALAIPLEPTKTKGGRVKGEFAGGPRLRNDLVFIKFRKPGNAIGALYTRKSLAAARGETGKVNLRSAMAAYLLVRQVDIAPKRFLRTGVLSEVPNTAARLVKFIAEQMIPPGSGSTAGAT